MTPRQPSPTLDLKGSFPPPPREAAIDRERYTQVKSLFLRLLELPEEEQGCLLANAEDPDLHAEVLQLLSYRGSTADAIDSLAPDFGGIDPMGSDDGAPFVPDQLGSYRTLGLLGRGSAGIVYRASHPDRSEPIALKVLPQFLSSPTVRSRFRQEAEALRRLDHPGIARIYDTGVIETDHGPLPYLAIELIEGDPLTDWAIRTRPVLPERLRILMSICAALEHAHDRGVIHRDLKPDNILVDHAGNPKILDFGIARITDSDLRTRTFVTSMGQLMGTLQYMSPEQAQAVPASIDARSDIYSLGVVAYELIASRLPYQVPGDSIPRAIITIATAVPEPLGRIDPACKGNVEAILSRALEKQPADRYASAALLTEDFARHLAGRPISSRPPRLATARQFVRRRGRALAATACLLGILAIAGYWVFDHGGQRPPYPDKLRALLVQIDESDQRLHRGIRTRDRVLEAIAILEHARRDASRIEPATYRHALTRFIAFRQGEAHYFLGVIDTNRELLATSEAFWQEAAAVPFEAEQLADLDTMVIASRGIKALSRHQPIACRGLAFEEMAIYRAPLANARQALHWRTQALAVFQGRDGPNYRTPEIEAQIRGAEEPIVLADLGQANVAIGALTDSVSYVNEGIHYLSQAVTKYLNYQRPSALASAYENLGLAYLRRAELARSTAALDSAALWLDQSLEMRSGFGRPLIYLRTKRELAQVAALRSRLAASDRKSRIADLQQALSTLESALLLAESSKETAETTFVRLQIAEVRIDLAEITADPIQIARADSLLGSVEQSLDRERFPIDFAALQVQRGRWARIAWRQRGDPVLEQQAERALQLAASIVPASQHPHLHRQIRAESAALASGKASPPS